MKNGGIKKYLYINWNSLKHKFDTDTVRRFSLLPELSIYYDSKGFFTFGYNDNEWCKELSIEFNFMFVRICYTFWWNFYKIDNDATRNNRE